MTSASGNRETAIRFLELAAAGEVEQAYLQVAPGFRHHNPYFASSAEALKSGMLASAAVHRSKVFSIQRVIAEGDLVAVHSCVHMPESTVTMAVVHIFRFENGLIAQLWDVGQAQPENMVNELGMF